MSRMTERYVSANDTLYVRAAPDLSRMFKVRNVKRTKIGKENAAGWHLFCDGNYRGYWDMSLQELLAMVPSCAYFSVMGKIVNVETGE